MAESVGPPVLHRKSPQAFRCSEKTGSVRWLGGNFAVAGPIVLLYEGHIGRRMMKSRIFLLLGAFALFGCARHAPPVAQSVAANGFACSGKGAPHSETGCLQAERIICVAAGFTSHECEAAKSTFALLPKSACSMDSAEEATLTANILKQRERCSELVMRICRDLGPKTSTCEMVITQTKTFPPSRCEMMLGRYSEVLAELRKMEAANRPLSSSQQQMIADTTGPSFGPLDARVVIVVFSDFQCPFCAKEATVTQQIRGDFKTGVRLVFRQFPLKFHQDAHLAAEASLAAHAQGKFWELHDAMFTNNKALSRVDIERYAVAAGLNMKRFNKDLDSHRYAADVDADVKVGKDVSVQGTPTMFINDTRVTNATDAAEITKKINSLLGR